MFPPPPQIRRVERPVQRRDDDNPIADLAIAAASGYAVASILDSLSDSSGSSSDSSSDSGGGGGSMDGGGASGSFDD